MTVSSFEGRNSSMFPYTFTSCEKTTVLSITEVSFISFIRIMYHKVPTKPEYMERKVKASSR